MADKTPNWGLHVIPPDQLDINVMDWVQGIGGDASTSNMMLLDAAVAKLQADGASKEFYSVDPPSDQEAGEVWNKILP